MADVISGSLLAETSLYQSGFITSLMIERFLQEGVPQNKSEEEQMAVNISYERYRKALIRAAQDYLFSGAVTKSIDGIRMDSRRRSGRQRHP